MTNWQDLATKLDRLWQLIETDHQTARTEILALIDHAKSDLANSDRGLGPWETELLGVARAEVIDDRFINLALVLISKAYCVRDLPQAQYNYGYNYGQRE